MTPKLSDLTLLRLSRLHPITRCRYSCKPKATPAEECIPRHATNHSVIPHAFADQFSTIQLFAPSENLLVFTSERGNSIAVVLSTYSINAMVMEKSSRLGLLESEQLEHDAAADESALGTWSPLWVTPFDAPTAVGGNPSRVYFVDGTLSTFGAFTPVPNANAFNVPFVITGQFVPLNTLGSSQPYVI